MNKVLLDLLEFKVKPFLLSHFSFSINFYYEFLSPFRADVKSFINYYILRRKTIPKLNLPETLTIVPTNICNARCVFCSYRLLNFKKEIMPQEVFRKVCDEYHNLGGKNLMFSPTMGEVTLNKSFFEEVKYAKMKGFKVNVFTNGISLNSHENYKKIVNSGIDEIVISTGDINPKYEAEILGISQDLATQKIRGLINLIEYKIKTKSNIKITIAFRAKRSFKQIWGSMKKMKFKKFFEKKALYIDFKTRYDNWCGIITQNDLLGIMKLKKRPLIRKYPCASLWRISILSNGDIRLCACRIKETEHDDLVIGNIRDESLVNIINNEKGQKILSEWQVGNIVDVCKECSRYMFPKFIRKKKIPIEYQNLFHR